jgi:hypothetical protein
MGAGTRAVEGIRGEGGVRSEVRGNDRVKLRGAASESTSEVIFARARNRGIAHAGIDATPIRFPVLQLAITNNG